MNEWDKYWQTCEESLIETLLQKYKINKGYKKLISVIPNLKGNILEIGAGKAWLSMFLNGTALDNNPNVVEKNKHKVKQYDLGDVFDLPYPDQSFDWAISCGLIEHFNLVDTKKIINEMKRVGENIVLWYPNCSIIWKLFWWIRNKLGTVPDDIYIHKPKDLGLKYYRAGFVRFCGLFNYIYVYGK